MFIWSGRAPAIGGSFTGLRQYYLTYKDYLDIKNEAPDIKTPRGRRTLHPAAPASRPWERPSSARESAGSESHRTLRPRRIAARNTAVTRYCSGSWLKVRNPTIGK